ncbi:TRAM domain-containing protein [Candidatus Bathyarchaeota archaeon]|nr:TRAM domain-containing protein [Candidatus Bathyarchaeota archaeon]
MPRRLPKKTVERGERSFRTFRRPVFDFDPRRQVRLAPVKEGEEHNVTIEAIGRKGDGIAKIQGFTIFVPGTKTGDSVKVRITSVRGSSALATVLH